MLRYLLRILLRLLFKSKVIGFKEMRFDGPTIVLPNHVSFLDAVFLYAYLPSTICYVINTDIAEKLRFYLQFINHIKIDPLNPYSLKKILGVLKAGKPLVIFPEGRITRTGSLMKIYSGIGFIAFRTNAAIYPVIFSGLEYSKFSRIQDKVRSKWFPEVLMYADEVIHLESGGNKSIRLQKREIGDKIRTILENTMFKAKEYTQVEINLFNELLLAGKTHGMNKMMAEDISGKITYRKTIISSYVLASAFRTALASDKRVGVLLPNSIGHVVALFALFYLNKTPAILNFSAGIQNNLDCGETAGIKTILTSRTFVEKANFQSYITQLAAKFTILYLEDLKTTLSSTDKASGLFNYFLRKKASPIGNKEIILFTSGSESKPKGVVLPHSSIRANLHQISCVIDYTHRDKMLNALPMFHSFGLTAGTLLPIMEGMEVFLYPSPLHYKMIPEIAYDRNVTILLGTPTFLMGYGKYAHNYDFYNVRFVLAGGEKLKDDVRNLWNEKFGIRIFEGYGTTEMSPVLSFNTPMFNRRGTVGKFLPGIQWRLDAVEGIENGGNLFVKGPNAMKGYLLHGNGFVPSEEWYNCGDVVAIDKEGFITIKSRLKRFAKISGEMISLDAVEKVAESCFATDKNAAISTSDTRKGEKIILYTLYKDATKQLLREYINQSGQSMLVMPTALRIVDTLPLLGSGKIDYVTLKEMAAKELGNVES
ncbi:AMP-binding protein [Pelosinus propionicus]|uniref:Acyl-[acyl-carrier-protein]-phospholipid O-acyltransferase / long-chain-fatty-acid--[acyl-carrier-protein] ligase n=1 Tax=Pelosinus propionicus DSM 13327 TaxID=1123291 RepID=A0A1I4HNA8_9FIRM|nr:AMP-binding protein [Pelosinus propionicus]SFL43207.1 acyl-[acyl-carrier-protein]-phospholipid O-acyltransferase / long-chain-fatty-acid--[acyl-carrier-protein] ligase [Pelosinus propionicus DSM 13327]